MRGLPPGRSLSASLRLLAATDMADRAPTRSGGMVTGQDHKQTPVRARIRLRMLVKTRAPHCACAGMKLTKHILNSLAAVAVSVREWPPLSATSLPMIGGHAVCWIRLLFGLWAVPSSTAQLGDLTSYHERGRHVVCARSRGRFASALKPWEANAICIISQLAVGLVFFNPVSRRNFQHYSSQNHPSNRHATEARLGTSFGRLGGPSSGAA